MDTMSITLTSSTFSIHDLLDYVTLYGDSFCNINDGFGSTMQLACVREGLFEYEDLSTEKCEKTTAELIEMYSDTTFTLDADE
jgi:hypothetical protein